MKILEKWGNYLIFNPTKFGRYCVNGNTSNHGITRLLISQDHQETIRSISAIRNPFVMKIREKWGNYPIFNPTKFGRYCVSGSTSNHGISRLLMSQLHLKRSSLIFFLLGPLSSWKFVKSGVTTPFLTSFIFGHFTANFCFVCAMHTEKRENALALPILRRLLSQSYGSLKLENTLFNTSATLLKIPILVVYCLYIK